MRLKTEWVVLFVSFLLFFPVYAIFNNAILYLFDILFTQGQVTKLFRFNYYGELLGCLGSAKYQEISKDYNYFQLFGAQIIQFLVSLFTFLILIRKGSKVKTRSKWILIFIFSFYLYTAIWFLMSFILYQDISDSQLIKHLLLNISLGLITCIFGVIIFMKVLNKSERYKVLMIVFPASFISAIIWFNYLGPIILPV